MFDKYALIHEGVKRKSGRYEYGSGENPYQHEPWFSWGTEFKKLKKEGLSEQEIAEALGLKSVAQLRATNSYMRARRKASEISRAVHLKEKQYSTTEIGKIMGIPESSVRELLKDSTDRKNKILLNTIDNLRDCVDKQNYIDIGRGVEAHLGISQTKLKAAVAALEAEGYKKHTFAVEQVGTGHKTEFKVLTKGDIDYKEVKNNIDKIEFPFAYTNDGGESYSKIEKPVSIDSKRIQINYAETGGVDKDGVIEIRRGVQDIDLGKANYAQVRIAVDDTHYLKGMAMYADDLPKGVDIRFNTNKKQGTPKEDVFKPLHKEDPDNPFKSSISKQLYYIDKDGNKKLSAINIVNQEGDWDTWSRNLASQMLSKQNDSLAKRQLSLTYAEKEASLKEIMSLTNPVIKKELLKEFADDCDSSAVHLKAAAMPRQSTHVILPFNTLKDNEIYAPNFKAGEKVVLIRYPHGGIFEIPELRVTHKNPEAKKIIGTSKDAVGINANVAGILSGADFDGDTVIVIPNNKGEIKRTSPLAGLKNFDPKAMYPAYPGMKVLKEDRKNVLMGEVSNLITDMTIQNADPDEIARAVRHSMVVIDASKHKLNYKQSYDDERIADLKEKYQGTKRGGASTIISRAKSPVYLEPRTKYYKIDPETGKKIYSNTDSKGNPITGKKIKSTKMAETDDARELMSPARAPMERLYADHANKLKALANKARKEYLATNADPADPKARITYQAEVTSLENKLRDAQKNAPLERRAQALANTRVAMAKKNNPLLEEDRDALKKIKNQALRDARATVGTKSRPIQITDREWKAIQARAISPTALQMIINYSDKDGVKKLATPRTPRGLSSAQQSRIRSMLNMGYTQAEVAEMLKISVDSVKKYM